MFLGAEGEMLENCVRYGRIILVALPFLMLQYAFSSLSVTAEKPKLGLIVTIVSGILNMTGDALFRGVFRWGIAGAAMASAMGQIVGGIVPLIYFFRKNKRSLQIRKPKGMASASSCLHQRRVRAYEQHFHVHCRHAEQPADGTAFPPVPGWWPSLWQIG